MDALPTAIDTNSAEFKARRAHTEALKARLRSDLAAARSDRSEKARSRHQEQGKLLVTERLDLLLDPGAPFLEIGALAAQGMYDGGVHKAGSFAGIGVICGRECIVSANDATVKGGAIYPMGVKKTLRLQAIALENRLPFVSLVDSGGAYLPLQSEVFPDADDGGRIFYNQAHLSRAGIPQLTAVMGLCTAGAAYIPAMSDEVVQVRGTGAIFLAGPPLVKAATGEDVAAEDLGGVELHARRSGVTDHVAEDDRHALRILRTLVAGLPPPGPSWMDQSPARPPVHDPEDLDGIVPAELSEPFDILEVIGRIVDDSALLEFKPLYGPTLVCGTARIHGYKVGILANNGVIFSECAQKAAHFVQLCEKRRVPLIFLQNVPGFMVGQRYEAGGITKHGHQMINAVATATVPKLTVIVGGSFGAGNYAMCGRAYGPRFLWAWPGARIGVMGAAQAASVLISVANGQRQRAGVAPLTTQEEASLRTPVAEAQDREGSAWYSTANLWDDGIIEPARTRDVLGLCLAVCARGPAPAGGGAFGTFRL
ncbi:MAG: methylcrotonoyl-CoA carboxylase [Myxococcales bacterium]|nr:methylcrotonoyl-CoA carboxylase [Myxococcales bacterium]